MKAVLFEERIESWAKNNGIIISDKGYSKDSGYHWIDIKQMMIYYNELKRLEQVCENMGLEITDIMISCNIDDKPLLTIWMK